MEGYETGDSVLQISFAIFSAFRGRDKVSIMLMAK
jgi:hypothetical protein